MARSTVPVPGPASFAAGVFFAELRTAAVFLAIDEDPDRPKGVSGFGAARVVRYCRPHRVSQATSSPGDGVGRLARPDCASAIAKTKSRNALPVMSFPVIRIISVMA